MGVITRVGLTKGEFQVGWWLVGLLIGLVGTIAVLTALGFS